MLFLLKNSMNRRKTEKADKYLIKRNALKSADFRALVVGAEF
jgi:hypothetical protein